MVCVCCFPRAAFFWVVCFLSNIYMSGSCGYMSVRARALRVFRVLTKTRVPLIIKRTGKVFLYFSLNLSLLKKIKIDNGTTHNVGSRYTHTKFERPHPSPLSLSLSSHRRAARPGRRRLLHHRPTPGRACRRRPPHDHLGARRRFLGDQHRARRGARQGRSVAVPARRDRGAQGPGRVDHDGSGGRPAGQAGRPRPVRAGAGAVEGVGGRAGLPGGRGRGGRGDGRAAGDGGELLRERDERNGRAGAV